MVWLIWAAIIAVIVLVWIHLGWIAGIIAAIVLFAGARIFDAVQGE
jgi:hypothetical protein